MRLASQFYKLPLCFDADRLAGEISQFAEADWREHPQGFAGNSALLLVSADGGQNDATWGEMRPTWQLQRCPYLQQVLAARAAEALTADEGEKLLRQAGERTLSPAEAARRLATDILA